MKSSIDLDAIPPVARSERVWPLTRADCGWCAGGQLLSSINNLEDLPFDLSFPHSQADTTHFHASKDAAPGFFLSEIISLHAPAVLSSCAR